MHVRRVNYQTLVWNSALDCYLDIPGPVGHGWALDDSGNLTSDWTNGEIMPQEIIDIICESGSGRERDVSDGNESSDNNGYEDERDGDNKKFEENDNMIDSIFEDSDDE